MSKRLVCKGSLKKQKPSQQDLTVRDRRSSNRKLEALTTRVLALEVAVLTLTNRVGHFKVKARGI